MSSAITPTSQQGGTTTSNSDAMTAPGSAPGTDYPASDPHVDQHLERGDE